MIAHFAPVLHVHREMAILHLNVYVLCANRRNSVQVLAGTLELHAFDMIKYF